MTIALHAALASLYVLQNQSQREISTTSIPTLALTAAAALKYARATQSTRHDFSKKGIDQKEVSPIFWPAHLFYEILAE